MKDHILEFLSPGTAIGKYRGHLRVRTGEKQFEVPLDDIYGTIIVGQDISISSTLISELINRNIAILFCSEKYLPHAMLLPYVGHFSMRERLIAQINAGEPFKKRLWQKIIRKKIEMQSINLDPNSSELALMQKFAKEVKSGDTQNHEAQAARIYWRSLFGNEFRRDTDEKGINSLLNYGYAILRAAVGRNIVACGLLPALGVFHKNLENPYCLVDDIMEPFRPIIDQKVKTLDCSDELTTEDKREMIAVLESSVAYRNEEKSLKNTITEVCQSLARAYLKSDSEQFDLGFNF